jgi:hypothetical protein
MRVDAVAAGTGDSWVGTALGSPKVPEGTELKPTRRTLIGVLDERATYYLQWHFPESSADNMARRIQSQLESWFGVNTGDARNPPAIASKPQRTSTTAAGG